MNQAACALDSWLPHAQGAVLQVLDGVTGPIYVDLAEVIYVGFPALSRDLPLGARVGATRGGLEFIMRDTPHNRRVLMLPDWKEGG